MPFNTYIISKKSCRCGIDFINNAAGSTVELDYIVLSSRSMNDEAQNLVSSVTVGDCPIEEFNSAADYCETGIYADVYSNLTAEDVAVTAATDDVKINIKNVTDRKIIDITAVSADGTYANTYRIVCKSIRRPAEPTSVIIDKCEINGKTVMISGKLSSGDSRSISLIAHLIGTGYTPSDILYIGKLRSATDGRFSKSFALYDGESTAKFYNIEFVIDVDGENTPVYEYKYYVNNKKLDESLEEIKNRGKGILEFMTDGDNEIIFGSAGIWIDLYKEQTDEIKETINTAAEKYKSVLTPENSARIANGSKGLSTFLGGYVLRVISKAGYTSEAIKIMKEYWGAMLNLGATTFWEDFDMDWVTERTIGIDQIVPDEMIDVHGDFGKYCYKHFRHSLCHGWASGPTSFLSQEVSGIKILEPGCKKMLVQPKTNKFKYMKTVYPTPYGPIEIEQENNAVKVKAPDGVELVGGVE